MRDSFPQGLFLPLSRKALPLLSISSPYTQHIKIAPTALSDTEKNSEKERERRGVNTTLNRRKHGITSILPSPSLLYIFCIRRWLWKLCLIGKRMGIRERKEEIDILGMVQARRKRIPLLILSPSSLHSSETSENTGISVLLPASIFQPRAFSPQHFFIMLSVLQEGYGGFLLCRE